MIKDIYKYDLKDLYTKKDRNTIINNYINSNSGILYITSWNLKQDYGIKIIRNFYISDLGIETIKINLGIVPKEINKWE